MSLTQKQLQVLTILRENLNNPQPQLVKTSMLAAQMDIGIRELQKVLKTMDGLGTIQTDPDLQYNLITREGLQFLKRQRPGLQL